MGIDINSAGISRGQVGVPDADASGLRRLLNPRSPQARLLEDGTIQWRLDGQLHRDDGPAEIRPSGTQRWMQHGKPHRDHGPAIITSNGWVMWWRHGQLHREDGPAWLTLRDEALGWIADGSAAHRPAAELETNSHIGGWWINNDWLGDERLDGR
jgi:hypothetical protein